MRSKWRKNNAYGGGGMISQFVSTQTLHSWTYHSLDDVWNLELPCGMAEIVIDLRRWGGGTTSWVGWVTQHTENSSSSPICFFLLSPSRFRTGNFPKASECSVRLTWNEAAECFWMSVRALRHPPGLWPKVQNGLKNWTSPNHFNYTVHYFLSSVCLGTKWVMEICRVLSSWNEHHKIFNSKNAINAACAFKPSIPNLQSPKANPFGGVTLNVLSHPPVFCNTLCHFLQSVCSAFFLLRHYSSLAVALVAGLVNDDVDNNGRGVRLWGNQNTFIGF